MSHHISDFFHINFFLVAPMALLVKFWTSSEETFPKVCTSPPPPPRFVFLNVGANVQNVLRHANSDILKMHLH